MAAEPDGTEPDSLARAFDPERFAVEGHALVDQLADYLRQAQARALPVLPWKEPAAQLADCAQPPSAVDLPSLVARTIAGSNHLHHPRYIGHQVTSPLPSSALLHLVTALLNNGTGVYEMGPASNAMERQSLAWMAARVGFPVAADGVLTSGGSLGNLTALLAARAATLRSLREQAGASDAPEPPLAVLASTETHYSVGRALQIMGVGQRGVVPVAVDERYRMRPDALLPALRSAQVQGRTVFAVVASAGSTSTGAFDPLEPIADFCAAHRLWLHVDGAHGGSAALSPKYRHLLAGVERADSLVWDAHKMMLLPALVTAVLFSDGARSYDTFSQEAEYLFTERNWWDSGLRTVECTKRMMGVELYGAIALHGEALFAEYVTRMFDRGRAFARRIAEAPDFELPTEPDGNIVCFRYRPAGTEPSAEALDALQDAVRKRLLADGSFYIVRTRLRSGVHLRVTIINPLTTEEDLAALLDALRAAAAAVTQG